MEPSPVAADDRALLGLLRGLANPHRHRVFRALCASPLRGKEVSAACGVTPQEASRHLARLVALGLAERRGRALAASDLGLRLAARLDDLRALQAAPLRLEGFDLRALPHHLSLGPLLAAGPHQDPDHRLVAEAEREALQAREEVLRLGPKPWPAWPLGAAGPARFAAVLLRPAEELSEVPPLPGGTRADLRASAGPAVWLVVADGAATLVLPRHGALAFDQPFRGSDPAWVGWCRQLFEHHARGATLVAPQRPALGHAAPAR